MDNSGRGGYQFGIQAAVKSQSVLYSIIKMSEIHHQRYI